MLVPTTRSPAGLTPLAELEKMPPGKSPKPTIPPDLVQRNASDELLVVRETPTIT
jgi:hypothetical protein